MASVRSGQTEAAIFGFGIGVFELNDVQLTEGFVARFVEPGQLVDRCALGSVHPGSRTKNRICVEHSPRNARGPAEFSRLCGLGLSRRRNAG